MTYHCPTCGNTIASWLLNKTNFQCPTCETSLVSNSKKTFKQSLLVAFVAWLIFLISVQQYVGAWGYAAAVSIEAGGIFSAIVATLYYKFVIKIEEQDHKSVASDRINTDPLP